MFDFDIRKLQDINLKEQYLKEQYYELFMNGNISEAENLIKEHPQLEYKVINADNLNKLIEHIMQLEKLYYQNVDDKLSQNANLYQIKIDDLIYLKDYESNVKYDVNNLVSYNGDIYFCYKPNSNIIPTNTGYWIKLGLKGEKGYYPLGVNYKGKWDKVIQYNKYDMVVYNNRFYVAKMPNNNENPNTSSKWSMEVQTINQSIFISETEPKNIRYGNVWIQILEERK